MKKTTFWTPVVLVWGLAAPAFALQAEFKVPAPSEPAVMPASASALIQRPVVMPPIFSAAEMPAAGAAVAAEAASPQARVDAGLALARESLSAAAKPEADSPGIWSAFFTAARAKGESSAVAAPPAAAAFPLMRPFALSTRARRSAPPVLAAVAPLAGIGGFLRHLGIPAGHEVPAAIAAACVVLLLFLAATWTFDHISWIRRKKEGYARRLASVPGPVRIELRSQPGVGDLNYRMLANKVVIHFETIEQIRAARQIVPTGRHDVAWDEWDTVSYVLDRPAKHAAP